MATTHGNVVYCFRCVYKKAAGIVVMVTAVSMGGQVWVIPPAFFMQTDNIPLPFSFIPLPFSFREGARRADEVGVG
jgi:hypothetical protein